MNILPLHGNRLMHLNNNMLNRLLTSPTIRTLLRPTPISIPTQLGHAKSKNSYQPKRVLEHPNHSPLPVAIRHLWHQLGIDCPNNETRGKGGVTIWLRDLKILTLKGLLYSQTSSQMMCAYSHTKAANYICDKWNMFGLHHIPFLKTPACQNRKDFTSDSWCTTFVINSWNTVYIANWEIPCSSKILAAQTSDMEFSTQIFGRKFLRKKNEIFMYEIRGISDAITHVVEAWWNRLKP